MSQPLQHGEDKIPRRRLKEISLKQNLPMFITLTKGLLITV